MTLTGTFDTDNLLTDFLDIDSLRSLAIVDKYWNSLIKNLPYYPISMPNVIGLLDRLLVTVI